MNKIKYIWRDLINNLLSKRLLVFTIFQFSILHYYLSSVKHFSIIAKYPATPWIFPFVCQDVYFLFVYGISVVCFYSNVPFLQRHEIYAFVRLGRYRWLTLKVFRIWLSATALSILEVILSILPLASRLEWTAEWGKLYNSLAMTDAGFKYNVRLFFPYEVINEMGPIITLLIVLLVMCIVTGLIGMVMFALSICINRTVAVFGGTLLAILPIFFANMYLYAEWISFCSPLSWMNLLLLYGKVCRHAPSLITVIVCGATATIIMVLISLGRIRRKALDWTEED